MNSCSILGVHLEQCWRSRLSIIYLDRYVGISFFLRPMFDVSYFMLDCTTQDCDVPSCHTYLINTINSIIYNSTSIVMPIKLVSANLVEILLPLLDFSLFHEDKQYVTKAVVNNNSSYLWRIRHSHSSGHGKHFVCGFLSLFHIFLSNKNLRFGFGAYMCFDWLPGYPSSQVQTRFDKNNCN